MAYSVPTLAINVGKYWRNNAKACIRARVTAGCDFGGRIGETPDKDSSVANKSAAWRKKASPRRLETVARYDCTNTRIRTISADGAGSSSGADMTCSTDHLGADTDECHLKIEGYPSRNHAAICHAAPIP